VVPKHRRSEPSLASVGAPVNTVDWPEPDGYSYLATTLGSSALRARVGPVRNGHPASDGYCGPDAEPGWAAASDGYSWQEWHGSQDWGPPPELYPDHPSAPVPRVQLAGDHPSRPMQSPRAYDEPDLPQRRPGASARNWSPPRAADVDYRDGNRWLHAVPDDAPAADYAPFPGQPVNGLAGPDWRETTGWQETTYYRHETGPLAPVPGPAPGRSQDGRSQGGDSLWTAGQVLNLANGQAAQIAQEAEDYAAAIREAAEREAAALAQQAASRADSLTHQAVSQAAGIREAAQRDAAELRARLDSMTGELGRLAAYVTEGLSAPAMPAIAPPLRTPTPPETAPDLPDTRPAGPQARPARPDTRPAGPQARPPRPDTRPAKPQARPTGPDTRPDTRPAKPDGRPGTRPAGPRTTPAGKPGKTRQQKAARVAVAGTAALLSVAAIGAVTYTGIHGLSFFVFRESGQGETPGTFTDANFLAGQKECSGAVVCPPAQHHDSAPKGRHHKAPGSK
jgi:hypothetical protein